jgi:phosphatidate cytidylyltransferase
MKKRLLSALVILLLFILFYILGGNYFIFADAIISLLAYKEIVELNTFKDMPNIIKIIGLISMLMLLFIMTYHYIYMLAIPYFLIALIYLLLLIPTLFKVINKNYSINLALTFIGLIIFLGIGFSSFNFFMLTNKMQFLFVIIITILNDTFAYLIGSLIGKTHFTDISPKKTMEGLVAGDIMGLVGGTIIYHFFIGPNVPLLKVVFYCLLLNLGSQIGDLLFSKIKRENNIKDFSNLIPGHGGILDRLDSLLITSLIYVMIIFMG